MTEILSYIVIIEFVIIIFILFKLRYISSESKRVGSLEEKINIIIEAEQYNVEGIDYLIGIMEPEEVYDYPKFNSFGR
jgi:hypothetical protein